MVDINPSTQNLAHCWYLIMRNYYYYCYYFLIIDSYLSSEHPQPSCRTPCSAGINVGDANLVEFSYSTEGETKAKGEPLSGLFYFEKMCMVQPLPLSLISTPTTDNRRTQVWVEIICLYGKQKYPTTITKALQIVPSSQPVIMRQFQ